MGRKTPLGELRSENAETQSVLLGSDSRKSNREKKKNKTLNAALDIMRAHLPELFYLEDQEKIDSAKFARRWLTIDQEIRNLASSQKEYHFIHNIICWKLEQGKRDGFWDFEIPSIFTSVKQELPTRSYQWHQYSIELAAIYQGIFDTLPSELSTSEHFSLILLSMIYHGGLNQTEQWVAVGHCLAKDKPFDGDGDFLYLRLILEESNRLATNTKFWDENKQAYINQTESVYVPDPISLGLIHQFLSKKELQWQPPATVAQCLKLINDTFELNLKAKALRCGGIAFAEQIKGVFLPQIMVEVALGKQTTSSLPRHCWNRFFDPSLYPVISTSFHSFVYKKSSSSISRNNVAQKQNAQEKAMPFFYEKLREIFSWTENKKKNRKELTDALLEIQSDELALSQSLLLAWFLHLLQERKNKASSVKRYFRSVAFSWLFSSQDSDLHEMDGEYLLEFYQDMIEDISSAKERHYCACRLDDLHQFMVKTCGFHPLPRSLGSENENQPHVSAGFVDELLFQGLLRQFDQFNDLSTFSKKMYQCFLIAAYRVGLRPSELAKLRMKDIEFSPVGWIYVRSNKHGDNKTASAKRKIPLMTLLTPEESKLFKEYIHERNLHNNKLSTLFFCQADNVNEKIDLSTLSRATSEILFYLSGGGHYRFYHLRHSALSRFQLMLHSRDLHYPSAIAALIPYDKEQVKQILELVCGKNRKRDMYFALAHLAGHRDPSVTFLNYLHFSDVIIGLIMNNNLTELSTKQAQSLFGLSAFQIRNYKKIHAQIMPKELAEQTKGKLKNYIKKPAKVIDKRQKSPRETLQTNASSKIAEDYYVAMRLLEIIQQGKSYDNFAWYYGLVENQILQWKNTAIALRNLKTSKEKSRLFPSTRLSQLLPASLQDKDENDDVQQALKKYQLHYASANDEALRWVVKYALTHCNCSRSGIYFDDADDYQCFMQVANHFFPSTRWRFLLKFTDDKVIKTWLYKSVELMTYRKKQQGRFANGAGWLLLKHKDEENRKTHGQARYSSHSFQIFLHRLAIILFHAEEIRDWA